MRSTIAVVIGLAASTSVAQQCSPLHYVYARATTEPPQGITAESTPAQFTAAASRIWSKGYGAAGATLWSNLTSPKSNTRIEGITGYPVPYPASTGNSATVGISLMIKEIESKSRACPKQKYVLGGHSQGGMVTVGAIRKLATSLPKEALNRIIAVTMFGSPACPEVVRDRCQSYCHVGDFVCDPSAKKGGKGGKGGKGKMPKSKGNTLDVSSPLVIRDLDQFPASCLPNVQERGHVPKTGSLTGAGPHLSYSSDGYYVKAAACYINEKYKASGGAGGAAVQPAAATIPKAAPRPKAAPKAAPKAVAGPKAAPAPAMAGHDHGH